MTDLFIEVSTREDYDALIRLTEDAGYMWRSGNRPTEEDNFNTYERDTVVMVGEDRKLEYCYKAFYVDRFGATITTLPAATGIKAIWRVQPNDQEAFFKGKSYKLPLPSNKPVIMLETTGGLVEGLMRIHEALAVDYKPQETEEVMPEKVKLPKFMCDWLEERQKVSVYPITLISDIADARDDKRNVRIWLLCNEENQWKLIDALRNGYEPEPEQLYYVPLIKDYEGGCLNQGRTDKRYLDLADKADTKVAKTKFTMPEIEAIDPRYKVFAVKVEEVDGNE